MSKSVFLPRLLRQAKSWMQGRSLHSQVFQFLQCLYHCGVLLSFLSLKCESDEVGIFAWLSLTTRSFGRVEGLELVEVVEVTSVNFAGKLGNRYFWQVRSSRFP